MLIKRKYVTSKSLSSYEFWQIANSVSSKGKSVLPPLFNGSEVLSYASDKAKLFAENFSKNSNLDDAGISLTASPSKDKLTLHNIPVTSKLIKKVITHPDL